MNEQKAPNGIEWTRIRKPDGSCTRGFTWNVLGGCLHGCQWEMPDGNIAECYAKTVAERVAQRAYDKGFEHHYFHPSRLEEPLKTKEPAGIFLDSMSDLMGHWVPDDQIKQVLQVCREAHWHTFFMLTKNAPRLLQFEFPDNVWVGVSSPPDWMFGKRLSRQQQEKMLQRTLKVLSEVKAKVRWISAEPLSWDCSEIFAAHPGAIQWVVIGAASNGPVEFPPDPNTVEALLKVLDEQHVPVFYKGNMRTLQMARDDWREEFPDGLYQPPPAPSPTTVVNFQDVKDHWNPESQEWDDEAFVYIGRNNPTYKLPGSIWANPFKLGPRDLPGATLDNYRKHIKEAIDTGAANIEKLRGKILVCWCAPQPCHGHILLDMLGEEVPKPVQAEPQLQQLALF